MISLEVKLLAALALFVALVVGIHHEIAVHDAGVRDAITAAYAAQAAAATASSVAEGNRRALALKDIANESQRMVQRAADDRALPIAAADRLRERAVSAFRGGSAVNPAAPAGSASSPGPGVSADVLSGTSALARRYADIADQSRIAGSECSAAYDALTNEH